MSDDPKISVVRFTPKKPERRDDQRDSVILAMHRVALATEELVRRWESYGDNIAVAINGAVDLADAGRWDELAALLRALQPGVNLQVSQKMPPPPDPII